MTITNAGRSVHCPAWCARGHDAAGDERGLHLGPAVMVRGRLVRLCATYDARAGAWDGPYVLVGPQEYTLDEADHLVRALIGLVGAGRASLVAQ